MVQMYRFLHGRFVWPCCNLFRIHLILCRYHLYWDDLWNPWHNKRKSI